MKKVLALLVAALFVSSPALAVDIAEGTVELSGAANVALHTDADDWDYNFDVNVDGFLYIMPDLGVGAIVGIADTSDTDFEVMLGPEATYNYSIDESTSAYAKAALVYNYSDDISVLGGVGAKYFLNESVSANCLLSLEHIFGDTDGTVLGIFAGISVYLP